MNKLLLLECAFLLKETLLRSVFRVSLKANPLAGSLHFPRQRHGRKHSIGQPPGGESSRASMQSSRERAKRGSRLRGHMGFILTFPLNASPPHLIKNTRLKHAHNNAGNEEFEGSEALDLDTHGPNRILCASWYCCAFLAGFQCNTFMLLISLFTGRWRCRRQR